MTETSDNWFRIGGSSYTKIISGDYYGTLPKSTNFLVMILTVTSCSMDILNLPNEFRIFCLLYGLKTFLFEQAYSY